MKIWKTSRSIPCVLILLGLIMGNTYFLQVVRADEAYILNPTKDSAIYALASGSNDAAVYGLNTKTSGLSYYGGHFETEGSLGRGVFGVAKGIYGYGVYGFASSSQSSANYGGYFRADGGSGIGVYGWAYNNGSFTNYGGYFKANGLKGRGIKAYCDGANSIGVYGQATGANSTGVWGEGVNYDFYANGPGTNYGSFTGAHDVKFAKDMDEDILPGLITSVTGRTEIREGKNGSISLSSTLPTVTISKKANDKKVFGVIVSNSPLPQDHWYKVEDGERFGIVNAVGEGRVWVTNRNGNIEAGDYITTSGIPGHGMLQDDDLLHSYTLGKAIESVDWGQVTETVEHDGQTYKRYLIAIVYTSG